MHIFKFEENIIYTDPRITKLQALAWNINAHQKIGNLIWQLIT